ncbi:hypothetical protein [Thermoflexus sp.]|uniref:hypothetical protein n=1 Tax=Thermoflexus sp. TaxID=1969742 RepID=UPI00262B50A1|nr:hypothetical protein [Thermoflexus sp.]MCX7690221.1 hypothetical protein [Thermoflexus sp.]
MKNKGSLAALVALASAIVALLAMRGAWLSSPGGFAMVSERSLRELGWEVEADLRPADQIAAEITNMFGLAPKRLGRGVAIAAWDPASAGVTEIHKARIAGIQQVIYPLVSPVEARQACEGLRHHLPKQIHMPLELEEVRSISIANGRGYLLVAQDQVGKTVWLIGCRASTLTILSIFSPNPDVPRELLPHLQSVVLGR